jgi:hypothetical protein
MYEVLFKYFEALKGHESALKELSERAGGYRTDHSFGSRILAKPRQLEILEEQLRMLGSKSESLNFEFARARELLRKATDSRHLQGLEVARNPQEVQEEAIQRDIQSIRIAEGLESLAADLRKLSSSLIEQMREETESIKQFTQDFPEIYVIESEK